MSVEVEPLDVHDDVAYDAWYDAVAAAQRHGREATATVWTRPELREQLRDESTLKRRWPLVAHEPGSGDVVGGATVVGSLVDNLDALEVEVCVPPQHRGRGVGAALLAAVEDLARAEGRSLLQSEVAWAHDDPAGDRSADLRWARAHGFRLGLVDVQRVLELPVDPGLLERLAAEAAPHHDAYRVLAWSGPVPEDLVDSWAALAGLLMTEAPTGEMTREVEVLDADAVRQGEALAARQGRTKHAAVALDADGHVVAYTDVATTVHEPGRAYQWGTLVRRDHRGHRLGTAIKVALLQHLARERPDLTHVRTWNAEVNAPMVRVNEALGYVPVDRLGELEKRLP